MNCSNSSTGEKGSVNMGWHNGTHKGFMKALSLKRTASEDETELGTFVWLLNVANVAIEQINPIQFHGIILQANLKVNVSCCRIHIHICLSLGSISRPLVTYTLVLTDGVDSRIHDFCLWDPNKSYLRYCYFLFVPWRPFFWSWIRISQLYTFPFLLSKLPQPPFQRFGHCALVSEVRLGVVLMSVWLQNDRDSAIWRALVDFALCVEYFFL